MTVSLPARYGQYNRDRMPDMPSTYASDMPEKFRLPSIDREPWVSTPLDANNVLSPEGELYQLASINMVDGLIKELEDKQDEVLYPNWLLEDMRVSLWQGISHRISQNADSLHIHKAAVLDKLSDEEVGSVLGEDFLRVYEYAKQGLAPAEALLGLLAHPKGLPALELAKLSHPSNWAASLPMDKAVKASILNYDSDATINPSGEKVHYVFYRANYDQDTSDLRSIAIGRKRPFAATSDGIEVKKRSNLIVRLDGALPKADRLSLEFRNHIAAKLREARRGTNFQEDMNLVVTQFALENIEPELAKPVDQRLPYLYPTSTSIYGNSEREPVPYRYSLNPDQVAMRQVLGMSQRRSFLSGQ